MSTGIFRYEGKNPDGTSMGISVEEMAPGSCWICVDNDDEVENESRSGYISRHDMIRMAERILWALRDGRDPVRKPSGCVGEIIRETWDRDAGLTVD